MPQSAAAVSVSDEKAAVGGTNSGLLSSRRQQNRKRPYRSASGTGEKSLNDDRSRGNGGSVVFTILLVGLVFSLVDVVYMIHVVHRDSFQPNNRVPDPETAMTDTNHGNDVKAGVPETPIDIRSGKKEIFDLIKRAHLDPSEMDDETISELPTWDEVVRLYGPKPIIHGLDRCAAFQNYTKRIGFVGAAGTFNSGTNLMAELLIANCHIQERMNKLGAKNRGIRWQVAWGKHTPPGDEEFRNTHKTDHDTEIGADQELPAVTIRDPLTWLISMCHHHYAAKWEHSAEHCPDFSAPNLETVVVYAEFKRNHQSILGLWNDYYREYLAVPWPRLIVRIEDLIFYPEETTRTVCECAGGSMRNDGSFQFIVNSAKKGEHAHGKERTGMVEAIIKYGSEKKRYESYISPKDLEYIRDNVDPELLRLMNYSPVDPSRIAA